MTDEQRNALHEAYLILLVFRDLYEKQIVPAMQRIYTDDDKNSLGACLGLIGEVLDEGVEERVIKNREMREKIKNAYIAVCEAQPQDQEEMDALSAEEQQMCCSLQACHYTLLNDTSSDPEEAVQKVNKVVEVGADVSGSIIAAGQGSISEKVYNAAKLSYDVFCDLSEGKFV